MLFTTPLIPGSLNAQLATPPAQTGKKMEVAVWDAYVKKKDGTVMQFDIVAPSVQRDTTVIHGYGRDYLATKGQCRRYLVPHGSIGTSDT